MSLLVQNIRIHLRSKGIALGSRAEVRRLHRYGLEEQGKEGIPLASFLVSKYSGIAYLCE